MKPPKCRLCQAMHWNNEPHAFASNTEEAASNSASNTKRKAAPHAPAAPLPDATVAAEPVAESVSVGKAQKQRWDRKAYNEYQRKLMKAKRAEAKAKRAKPVEELSEDEKLREQFKREQREFFESFCKNPELFPDEPPAKHHQFMIGALQGVANGARAPAA